MKNFIAVMTTLLAFNTFASEEFECAAIVRKGWAVDAKEIPMVEDNTHKRKASYGVYEFEVTQTSRETMVMAIHFGSKREKTINSFTLIPTAYEDRQITYQTGKVNLTIKCVAK